MVEINPEELAAILKTNKELTERLEKVEGLINPEGTGTLRVLRRIKEHNVIVRRIDGKVVLGYKNRGYEGSPLFIYTKPDPKDPTQKLEYVDVILEGMKTGESMTLPYGDFRKQSERVTAKVIDTKEQEWEMNQGMTKKKEVDGYSMSELDFDIPMDVIGKVRLYTVELPGGHQVTIHENYVNIA